MMKKMCVLAVAALLAACFVLAGCSNKVSLEEGRAKIAELAAKGVPEREMSTIRMYLHQMETARRVGNGGLFRVYQDSLTRALAAFETKMLALLEESGPFMDSLRRACDGKIAQLRGLHLEAAERGKAAIDSLMEIQSQKILARYRLEAWALDLDTLVMQQRLADSLRSRFIGTWVMEQESADPRRFNVVDRTEIRMRTDGTLLITETKRGRSSDFREDDWEFRSEGTWDLKGDVAHQSVTRERRIRQTIRQRDEAGRWHTHTEPPYDSTFAKGRKELYISWSALQADYRHFPRYR